jgi:hypothetical protein
MRLRMVVMNYENINITLEVFWLELTLPPKSVSLS